MKIEELNLDVRTYNAVRRAGCTTVEELRQRMADDPDDLRRNTGSSTFDRIEEMLAGMQEPQAAVIVSEDYTRAVTLTRSIIANAQAAQQSLYEVCKGLKEMRDGKLYKELGYQNFEDYTENEVGIKKVQAYNFVAIASNLSADYVQSIEPQISALTAERDEANAAIEKKDKQFRQAMDSKNNELTEVKAGWKRRSDTLLEKIAALKKELEEAKAEPQEVAVEDTSRVEELEKQLAECKRQLSERQAVQMALPGDGGERRRGEFAAISNAVEHAMEDLMDFLEDNDHCSDFRYFANRAKEKLREYNSKLNDMLAKEETPCQ